MTLPLHSSLLTPNLWPPGAILALLFNRNSTGISSQVVVQPLSLFRDRVLTPVQQAGSLIYHRIGPPVRKIFLGDLTQMWYSVGISMALGFLFVQILK